MLQKLSLKMITATGLLLAAPLAGAHEGLHLHAVGGFAAGFLHPLTGLDHLLVALAAGGWALHGSRNGLWRLALFITSLLCGMLLAGHTVFGVLAVLALAVLVSAVLQPRIFPHVLFGGVALWHGMLHLQEMPVTVTLSAYVGGLLLSTALLLAAGMGAWRILGRRTGRFAD